MPSALTKEPRANATATTSPRTISEKYSAAPNFSAAAPRAGANSAMIMVETVPAKKDASAAMDNAGPARPCRAIL